MIFGGDFLDFFGGDLKICVGFFFVVLVRLLHIFL